MGLLIIFPLLVSGYLVCIKHPYYFYRLHRFEGQLLYLQVARLGVVCLIVATLLSALVLIVSKQQISIAGQPITTDYSRYLGALLVRLDIANAKNCALWVFLLQVALTSIAIPFLWAQLYRRSMRRLLELQTDLQLNRRMMFGILEGSPLRMLLQESAQNHTVCMFSLNNRKVYVGIVSFVGIPTESEGLDHAFTLVPLLSGYREKDTLEVTLGTRYLNPDSTLPITLLQETVVSATRFDFPGWTAFQARKSRKARTGPFYSHRPVKASSACA